MTPEEINEADVVAIRLVRTFLELSATPGSIMPAIDGAVDGAISRAGAAPLVAALASQVLALANSFGAEPADSVISRLEAHGTLARLDPDRGDS